jgi:hypothetical protein
MVDFINLLRAHDGCADGHSVQNDSGATSDNPNDVGKDLVRYFEFSEERITLIPTRLVGNDLAPKSEVKRRLTWEKVNLSRMLD